MLGTLAVDSYIDLLNQINIRESSSNLRSNIIEGEENQTKISVEELFSIIYYQKKRIEELTFDNIKLNEKLSLNSQNSSKPPSSDNFTERKPRTKSEREKGNKKSGSQTGRKGKTLNQKVFEHLVNTKKCLFCKTINKGSFPSEVKARVQYSKRIKRIIAYLFTHQFIPYERLTDYFIDIYGHRISEGTVSNALKEIYNKLEPWEEEVRQDILRALIVHFDEGGIKENGKLKWLHVTSTYVMLIT